MNPALAPLLAVALAVQAPATEAPSLGERLRWNARERTAAGARALAAGDAERATTAFDIARRLRPSEPLTSYNSGTARIGRDADGAEALLGEAARAAGAELAPAAWYNLGTARLAAGDAGGAVEAFREALRRAPDDADAKHNLELALRERERQSRSRPSPGGAGERRGEERSPGGGGETGSPRESREPTAGEAERRQGEPTPSAPRTGEDSSGERRDGERRLPRFRDLPDMTAEQAAAILRAVEALERQQRRERAQRSASDRAQVEIDW